MREVYGPAWRDWPAEDFAGIRQPLDFLGINYYTRGVMRADPTDWPLRAGRVPVPDARYSATNWEVCPAALTDTLCWVRARYGEIPLYITENGAAFDDPPVIDGAIDDQFRVDYLREHLRAVRAAITAGVDVRGYYVWSLLDNLEWAHGYSKRFGIVHVDYATQRRTPKASANFYATIARTNGATV